MTDNFMIYWDRIKEWALKLDGTVLEDDQILTVKASDTYRFHELTPQGTSELPVMAILDEAHMQLNARDWNDTSKRAFFNWLTQSRHDDVDVIFISQHQHNVDKQIARLCTYVTNIRNMATWKIAGLGCIPWRKNSFRVNQYDQDGKTLLESWYIPKDKKVFKCYESKAMRGKHKRNGIICAKKSLQKVEQKKMKIYGILTVVVVTLLIAGVVIYRRFSSSSIMGPPAHIERQIQPSVAPVKPSPTPPASTEKDGPTAIVGEEYVRGDGETYLQTENGMYKVGEFSPWGRVIKVSGMTAECKSPFSGKLIVHGKKIRVEVISPQPGTRMKFTTAPKFRNAIPSLKE